MIDDLPDLVPIEEKKILAKMARMIRMARTVARRFGRPPASKLRFSGKYLEHQIPVGQLSADSSSTEALHCLTRYFGVVRNSVISSDKVTDKRKIDKFGNNILYTLRKT